MTLMGNNAITLRKLTSKVTVEKGILLKLSTSQFEVIIKSDIHRVVFFFFFFFPRSWPQVTYRSEKNVSHLNIEKCTYFVLSEQTFYYEHLTHIKVYIFKGV